MSKINTYRVYFDHFVNGELFVTLDLTQDELRYMKDTTVSKPLEFYYHGKLFITDTRNINLIKRL